MAAPARPTKSAARSPGIRLNGSIGPISLLLLLVPGIYMATTAWAWPAWTIVSFWTLIAIAVLGATVTRRRLAAIAQGVKGDDRGLSANVERLTCDPLLRTSFYSARCSHSASSR